SRKRKTCRSSPPKRKRPWNRPKTPKRNPENRPAARRAGRCRCGGYTGATDGGGRAMMRQFELVELVKSYDPNADEGLLNRAYVYSMKAHGAQLRASGDPYFSHPIQVAGLLAQMKLDSASIVTGLLHDTIEDTVATLDEIERQFGPEVGRLVDGVTKLSRIELQSDQTKQAENFRKLVLAMSEDIRVL